MPFWGSGSSLGGFALIPFPFLPSPSSPCVVSPAISKTDDTIPSHRYGASETGNKEPSLDTKEKVVRPEHVAEAEVEVEPKTGHVEDSLVG